MLDTRSEEESSSLEEEVAPDSDEEESLLSSEEELSSSLDCECHANKCVACAKLSLEGVGVLISSDKRHSHVKKSSVCAELLFTS